ncbi:MAG: hypothetical protein JNJ99_15470 [Crocinitomicaceae bacterium]|nr:hypothetical protein [Crocinitomicaceae bacterium]
MKKQFTEQEIVYIETILQSFDTRYPDRPTMLKILMQQQPKALPTFAEKAILDACVKAGITTTKYDVNFGQLLYPTQLSFDLLASKKPFQEYFEHVSVEEAQKQADRLLVQRSIQVSEESLSVSKDSFKMSKRNTIWVIIGVGVAVLALIVSVIALLK